jgi:hypothetical protein
MGKHTSLGLDELMIVNPGPPGGAAVYLGADGVFYRAPGVGRPSDPGVPEQFFLGDDGALYRVRGAGLAGLANGRGGRRCGCGCSGDPGRYFLGDDGWLYEAVGDW